MCQAMVEGTKPSESFCSDCLSAKPQWQLQYWFPTFALSSMWWFPKMGVPQNGWFILENASNMDDASICSACFYLLVLSVSWHLISQLQGAMHGSWLTFSSDGGLSTLSVKLTKSNPSVLVPPPSCLLVYVHPPTNSIRWSGINQRICRIHLGLGLSHFNQLSYHKTPQVFFLPFKIPFLPSINAALGHAGLGDPRPSEFFTKGPTCDPSIEALGGLISMIYPSIYRGYKGYIKEIWTMNSLNNTFPGATTSSRVSNLQSH